MRAMVITVGTGRGVAHGIKISIENANPDLILFIGSTESKEKTLPELKREIPNLIEFKGNFQYKSGEKPYFYVFITDEEVNDVEKIYFNYTQYIREILLKNFDPIDIVADYTSGTKSMSAGLFASAVSLGIGRLSYVHGERDKDGRVISGKERVTTLTPSEMFFERRLLDSINLFNHFQYRGSLRVLMELKENKLKPEQREEVEFLMNLIEGYHLWDRFYLKEASDKLSLASKSKSMANKYGISKKLTNAIGVLKREQHFYYEPLRALDLIANAERRMEVGRFDDATARLYRTVEFMVQSVLYREYEIETKNVDLEKIPEILRGKYECFMDSSGKISLPLARSYELLKDLGNEFGKKVSKEFDKEGRLNKFLYARNNSILAHGFDPIKEKTAREFLEYLKINLVPIFYPDFEKYEKHFKFPKLKVS
jgi:CRISPR-associated protein (TIGR02710 family)